MNDDFKSTLPIFLLTALSLSIGWGIRGNFGHEFGAMIPGALAAMAFVLLGGRRDWQSRIAWFGMFGAIGWSFGGSMSYGQVIGYTHSGHSASVLYGFVSLFLIGFLWAAIGGAGTALPATLSREKLNEFILPLIAVFVAWFLQDIFENSLVYVNPDYRQESPLYWYDTDWLAATTAIAAILILSLIRRRIDQASSLILHAAAGWWVGFAVLVLVLGWRMTPPRGDSWAGCVGMTAGIWLFFYRQKWNGPLLASIVSAFFGGFGFASATAIKLMGLKTGWATNWHSVMEQTYGFINGIGLAAALIYLSRNESQVENETGKKRWMDLFAAGFVLLLVPWLNLRKNPEAWVKAKTVPAMIAGISSQVWFDAAFILLGVAVIALMIRHHREPVAMMPSNWLGKGQALYLVFLWMMVAGNFERAIVSFAPQRMITEGVIFLNAVICSMILLIYSRSENSKAVTKIDYNRIIKKAILIGIVCASISILLDWGVVRAIYGNNPASGGVRQIRFGTEATATTEKPKAGQPHP